MDLFHSQKAIRRHLGEGYDGSVGLGNEGCSTLFGETIDGRGHINKQFYVSVFHYVDQSSFYAVLAVSIFAVPVAP